jgi:hypothetical protein
VISPNFVPDVMLKFSGRKELGMCSGDGFCYRKIIIAIANSFFLYWYGYLFQFSIPHSGPLSVIWNNCYRYPWEPVVSPE